MLSKFLVFFVGVIVGWISLGYVSIPSETRLHEISIGKFTRSLGEATDIQAAHWSDCTVGAAETRGVYREVRCTKELPSGEIASAWYPFTITGGLDYFDFNVLPRLGETS